MKPTEKFENFLMEQHAKQYMGTDDNMPDDFNKWLCNLEVDEWLAYGDKFNLAVAEALPEIVSLLQDVLNLMNEEGREYWRVGLVTRIEQALKGIER